MTGDIATKEALAVNRVLRAFHQQVRNARVDVNVDNQAVMHSWNNQGGRSQALNNAMKTLFFTSIAFNFHFPVMSNLCLIPR